MMMMMTMCVRARARACTFGVNLVCTCAHMYMEVYAYMCMCIYMQLCMYVGTLISIHIDPHTSEPFFGTSHSQARLACYRQLLADALSLTADALPLTRMPLVQAHRSAEHEKRPASILFNLNPKPQTLNPKPQTGAQQKGVQAVSKKRSL